MAGYTVGMSLGQHAEEHSRRRYTPFSAEQSLANENVIIYDCGDDKEHFNKFFRSSIEEYNSRQKRADRKKSLDYYDALLDGTEGYGKGDSQEKPVYHYVMQIGNRNTNGVTDDSFDVEHWRQLKRDGKYHEAASYVKQHKNDTQVTKDLKQVLIDFGNEMLENKDGKYDGILIHGLVIHADEPNGTIHLDIRFTFYTDEGNKKRKDGKNNGLATRVSMNKALAKLGFKTTKLSTGLDKFRESLKDRVGEIMAERGYERDFKNEKRAHLEPAVFEATRELEKAEARTKELEEKADNLQTKIADIDERESKVAEDEERIRIKQKKQDEEHKRKSEELDEAEKDLLDFRDQGVQFMLDILRRVNPDGEEKQFNTITELREEVDRQVKRWGDAVDQRETAVGAREAKIDDMIKTIEDIQASAVNAEVFETETLSDGRKIPKRLRDEHGRIQKDANGKVILAPARKINDVVEDLNRMKSKLDNMKANLDVQATEKELER